MYTAKRFVLISVALGGENGAQLRKESSDQSADRPITLLPLLHSNDDDDPESALHDDNIRMTTHSHI